jgi:type IV pilus assembly protein PilA
LPENKDKSIGSFPHRGKPVQKRRSDMSPKANQQLGFTLIELMIVIAIIGILAAIAIPQFTAYRKRSYNSAAQSDIRNASTAQEAYYVENRCYSDQLANLIGTNYGLYNISQGVKVDVAAGTESYTLTSYHSSGNRTFAILGPGGVIQAN